MSIAWLWIPTEVSICGYWSAAVDQCVKISCDPCPVQLSVLYEADIKFDKQTLISLLTDFLIYFLTSLTIYWPTSTTNSLVLSIQQGKAKDIQFNILYDKEKNSKFLHFTTSNHQIFFSRSKMTDIW